MSHAFEPDHVAAITTQSRLSKINRFQLISIKHLGLGLFKNSILGALWGLGHTSMLILVSILIFVFSINMPTEIFQGFEFVVGIMLVILGMSSYKQKNFLKLKHKHHHKHDDGVSHTHLHAHTEEHKHGHKAYLIGCIHGLAGSGSLVILSLSTLGNIQSILFFVLIFGVGSIVGMMIVSGALGLPISILNNSRKINKILRYSVATISLVIGLNIIFEILNFSHVLN